MKQRTNEERLIYIFGAAGIGGAIIGNTFFSQAASGLMVGLLFSAPLAWKMGLLKQYFGKQEEEKIEKVLQSIPVPIPEPLKEKAKSIVEEINDMSEEEIHALTKALEKKEEDDNDKQ